MDIARRQRPRYAQRRAGRKEVVNNVFYLVYSHMPPPVKRPLSVERNIVRHVINVTCFCIYIINKCKKNCSLSTSYNGEMTHRKQQYY